MIDQINEHTARLADGKKVHFLNISKKLADKAGALLAGMSPARLHLSEKGYQVLDGKISEKAYRPATVWRRLRWHANKPLLKLGHWLAGRVGQTPWLLHERK